MLPVVKDIIGVLDCSMCPSHFEKSYLKDFSLFGLLDDETGAVKLLMSSISTTFIGLLMTEHFDVGFSTY